MDFDYTNAIITPEESKNLELIYEYLNEEKDDPVWRGYGELNFYNPRFVFNTRSPSLSINKNGKESHKRYLRSTYIAGVSILEKNGDGFFNNDKTEFFYYPSTWVVNQNTNHLVWSSDVGVGKGIKYKLTEPVLLNKVKDCIENEKKNFEEMFTIIETMDETINEYIIEMNLLQQKFQKIENIFFEKIQIQQMFK